MRIFYSLALLCLSLTATSQSFNYSGNGATGFGGGVGNSTLTVTTDATNVYFSVTSATNTFDGNNLVLYIDSKPGGVNNTSTFTDLADAGRRAISGANSTIASRTVANFPTGFGADYGISVEIGSYAGLFDLSTPSNFGFIASGGIAGSGTGPITFSYSRAALGITGTATAFSFVGTLISGSAYRSNETYGGSVTIPGDPGSDPNNAGFNGSTTFSAANNYSFSVLPLRLLRFDGRATTAGVELTWATAAESNVRHFEIQSSTTGTDWATLATVPARNTTSADYAQTVTPLAGHRLYRLRTVDQNGRATTSAILDIAARGKTVKLLANPVHDAVRFAVNGDAATYTAAITTLDGRQVRQLTHRHPGGASTLRIDAAGLSKGTYVVMLTAGADVQSFRVVVE